MSGFSEHWLSLRETVDHAAINPELLKQVAAHFAGQADITVTDLGSGSGSSLRAISPVLPANQTWRLVDNDRLLLDHARRRLSRWADRGYDSGDHLHLVRGEQQIKVEFKEADIGARLPQRHVDGAQLVTASAFFDLTSEAWIKNFCRTLAELSAPLYALLTYDGSEVWQPPHPADPDMLRAFHHDQRRDKGFGPAAGPQAAAQLAKALEESGYSVRQSPSPWRLDVRHKELIDALAQGSAQAVAQTGMVRPAQIASWQSARRDAASCVVGHADIFGVPIRRAGK